MSERKIRQANESIAEKVRQAQRLLDEAAALADEHGISFDFRPAYGMGGTYYPKRTEEQREKATRWESSNEGWRSSSSQC